MDHKRQCGECQLCCKLLPVADNMAPLHKPANTRCQHQRFGKGCAIYTHRPVSCAMWSCRWLINDDMDNMKRPDRSRYVIDPVPDFVEMGQDGVRWKQPIVQVWCDPAYHRAIADDSELRAWCERKGTAALLRCGSSAAILIAPPSVTGGDWVVKDSNMMSRPPHTAAEVALALQSPGRQHAVKD